MINGLTNKDFVLDLLSDGRPHYSREFVQASDGTPLLLDYRKRISELRREGHNIQSVRIGGRPGYVLSKPMTDLFAA